MNVPPAFLEELLRRLLRPGDREAVLGDLAEAYNAKCASGPDRAGAVRWYCREALLLLLHALRSDVLAAFRPVASNRRKNMSNPHQSRMVSAGVTVLLNVVAAALFWGVGFAMMQVAQRVHAGWMVTAVVQVVACAIGVAIAVRLRAHWCLYLAAGQLAFALAELVIHSVYGIRAAQGAPTHFAVMLAGTAGVLLGLLLARRPDRGIEPPVDGRSLAPASGTSRIHEHAA